MITPEMVIKEFMRTNKDADEDLVFGISDEYDVSRRVNDGLVKLKKLNLFSKYKLFFNIDWSSI